MSANLAIIGPDNGLSPVWHQSSVWTKDGNFRVIWFQVSQFLPEASLGLWVLPLPASVCGSMGLSVYPSRVCLHNNSSPVEARITYFGPEMQNTLVKIHIHLWLIDFDFRGQILLKSQNLLHFELVFSVLSVISWRDPPSNFLPNILALWLKWHCDRGSNSMQRTANGRALWHRLFHSATASWFVHLGCSMYSM